MISQETGITSKMQPRKDVPSMLELCEIFKKKREFLWSPNDGSELDENPCYRRILARSFRVDTTVEERVNAIEVGTDGPSWSRQTRRSTVKLYETRISLSREKKDLLGDTTVERRRDLRFSYLEKVTEVSESEDNESFSEEEYYPDTLEGNSLTRAARKQNQKLFIKGKHGQAANLYGQVLYREMNSQQGDEERFYRNEMAQGATRRDTRHYLHHEAACSSSQANTPSYSHSQAQGRSGRKANQPHFQDSVFVQRRQNIGSPQRSLKQTAHLQQPVQRFTRNVAAVPCQLNSTAEEQRVRRRCGRQEADSEENSHNRSRRIGVCQGSDETREHRTFVRVLRKRF